MLNRANRVDLGRERIVVPHNETHDPTGPVDDVHRRSRSLVYHPSAAEVERWRYKVLAYAHEVYRRCRRGELSYARKMLLGLAGYAMAGWHMEAGPVGGLGESGRAAISLGLLATRLAPGVASAVERAGHVGSDGHDGTGTGPPERSTQRVDWMRSGPPGVAASVGHGDVMDRESPC